MSVEKFRIKKGFSFTVISTKVVQNLKNYEALGLYAYLLSLPDEWVFHKKQLSEHGAIGRDKIDFLLKTLAQNNLIEIAHLRNEKGCFAQIDIHVKDGSDFKINNLEENAQPLTDLPLTDNQLLVNSTYKRNIDKINNLIQEKDKIYYATDVAQEENSQDNFASSGLEKLYCGILIGNNSNVNLFEEFWKMYPRKKDKKRSFAIWKKKNYDKIYHVILQNVALRIKNDPQWKNIKYIPHPSTFLRNERFNDEIDLAQEEAGRNMKLYGTTTLGRVVNV